LSFARPPRRRRRRRRQIRAAPSDAADRIFITTPPRSLRAQAAQRLLRPGALAEQLDDPLHRLGVLHVAPGDLAEQLEGVRIWRASFDCAWVTSLTCVTAWISGRRDVMTMACSPVARWTRSATSRVRCIVGARPVAALCSCTAPRI
jgi:hypothetical protein